MFICVIFFSGVGMTLAIVTQDYSAQAPEELSLQKNRIVTVLDRNVAEGWWKGDLNGKIGVFPANVNRLHEFFLLLHLTHVSCISTWNLWKKAFIRVITTVNQRVKCHHGITKGEGGNID